MAKKLSTEEILAAARAQSSESTPPAADSEEKATSDNSGQDTTESPAVEKEPTAEAAKPTPAAGAPKSTQDILAAARAQTGGAKKEAAKPTIETAKEKDALKSAPAGAPKSTADILAAARGQSGGVTKQAAATKPTATAPVATKPTGETPSVQEMLKAVREGKPQPTAEKKPAAPQIPQKPSPLKRPTGSKSESRRNFLVAMLVSPFVAAWVLFSGASLVFLLGCARFMFPNVLIEPPMQFKIGRPSDYPPESVDTKWKAGRGIWIIRTTQYNGLDTISALISVCTHLGCTPNWLEGEQKFKCPCHGSGFYITGVNFEGPAPRPLERAGIRLAEDGMLEVDKSVKFQQEMGQWEDATSYVQA